MGDLISGFDFVLFYYYFFPIFSFFFSIEISMGTYGDTRKKNICQAFMYTPPSTKVLVYQLKTKEKCVCMCERASARARPLTCNLWLKEDNCKKDRKYQNLQKKKKTTSHLTSFTVRFKEETKKTKEKKSSLSLVPPLHLIVSRVSCKLIHVIYVFKLYLNLLELI